MGVQAVVQAAAGLQDNSSAAQGSPGLEQAIVASAVAVLSAVQAPALAAKQVVAELQRCLAWTPPSMALLRLLLAVVDLPAVCTVRSCWCAPTSWVCG